MNQDRQTQPNHISIDVEQWRSDISTFVETTSQALTAIIAELSGSCSSGFSASESPTQNIESTENAVSASPVSPASIDTCRDDRLEKLKSQLAQRISKSV
jgi:hypothetical protein